MPFVSIPSSEGGILTVTFLIDPLEWFDFAPGPFKHEETQGHVRSNDDEIDVVGLEDFF